MNEQELKAMGQFTRDLPERLAYAKALEDLQQLGEEYRFWSGEALREVERLDDVIYEAEQRRRRLREDLSTMPSLWQEPQTS